MPPDLSAAPSADGDDPMLLRFLDCVSPSNAPGVRGWFRAVADLSPQSELLETAVKAMASLFFALQCSDPSLLRESQRLHVATLAKLRHDIAEPSSSTGLVALYATLLLVCYEVSGRESLVPRP